MSENDVTKLLLNGECVTLECKRANLRFSDFQMNAMYKDIHLEAAEQIFIAGDRSKPQHDAINVECVESICNYLASKSSHTIKRITCMFEDLDTYASFRTTDIFSAIT